MKLGFESYAAEQVWKADVVVLGAGAGGSAVACALAEAGLDVLVLEEGRHWRPDQFQADSAWAYRNIYAGRGSRSAAGNCLIPVPGGRGVGGSTLINSAICFRTPDPVLKDWSESYGCSRLTHEQMSPLLDRVWRTIGVTVNPVEVQRNNNLIFKAGSDRLGLPGQWMARSAPTCVGCGVCQFGCPTGGKSTVDRSFLQIAIETGRVRVHADCRVETVEVEGSQVRRVHGLTIDPSTLEPAGRFTVEARQFVLSAGPIGSPRFLQKNGLAEEGICGGNLHLHPASGMLARFIQEIRPWHGVTQGYYVDRWDRGYLLQTFTTSPDQTYVAMPWSLGDDLVHIMRDLIHMAMAGPLVHDVDSIGTVGWKGMTYFVGEQDRRTVIAGLRECARVFFSAGATEIYPPVIGGTKIRSEADIDRVIHEDIPASQLYLYASHPMGTCRMGADPSRSVVDPDGRVWGWDNLYVSDASVFPTSLGVNPQVTTMAVGLTIGAAVASRA